MAVIEDGVPTCLRARSFPDHGYESTPTIVVVLTWDNPEAVDGNVVEMDSGRGWIRLYESAPTTKVTVFTPPRLPIRFRVGTRESVARQKWTEVSL